MKNDTDVFLRTRFFHTLDTKTVLTKINSSVFSKAKVYCKDTDTKHFLSINKDSETMWSHITFMNYLANLVEIASKIIIESRIDKCIYRETLIRDTNGWSEFEFNVYKPKIHGRVNILSLHPYDSDKYFYEEARLKAVKYRGQLWIKQLEQSNTS